MEHLTLGFGICIITAKYFVATCELRLWHILQTVCGPWSAKDILILIQQLRLRSKQIQPKQRRCKNQKIQFVRSFNLQIVNSSVESQSVSNLDLLSDCPVDLQLALDNTFARDALMIYVLYSMLPQGCPPSQVLSCLFISVNCFLIQKDIIKIFQATNSHNDICTLMSIGQKKKGTYKKKVCIPT